MREPDDRAKTRREDVDDTFIATRGAWSSDDAERFTAELRAAWASAGTMTASADADS